MRKYQIILLFLLTSSVFIECTTSEKKGNLRSFNGEYSGEYLNRVAFPMGGLGAGMICLEGTGAISHVSVRNNPSIKNEPFLMAAISVKGIENGAKVLEGPVPGWKIGSDTNSGNGAGDTSFGLPRFQKASFSAKFPFGEVELQDDGLPLEVKITGWSPFIPADADNSSLPVAGLEYTFKNTGGEEIEVAFSYHAQNFMQIEKPSVWGGQYLEGGSIAGMRNGFLLSQECFAEKAHYKGNFAIFSDDPETVVDLCWFRGGGFDSRTMLWKDISEFTFRADTTTLGSPGASLFVPFKLKPGEEKTIKVLMAWYVPHSDIRSGLSPVEATAMKGACVPGSACCPDLSDIYYEPWYSGRFKNIDELTRYWSIHYNELREKSNLFSQTFYASSLPPEVLEAVAANLTILKSPTVLRLKDGRLWGWEGCFDKEGCCPGSCTHVWNYAQAIPHLFPDMERSLRQTEFFNNQNALGHQSFRSTLPIKTPSHLYHAAADGQLGGIMKAYREWRISGDTDWMKTLYPAIKQSMDYCIHEWDPMEKGALEEPHHNTYDIEFWGPDGMTTSIYLGALSAMIGMGKEVGDDISRYKELLLKGKQFMETELFDGEYFFQQIKWEGLEETNPEKGISYSDEARALLQQEGPKYQYGTGCLSDGVWGCWLGTLCGIPDFIDPTKIKSHLLSVYKYNLKKNLSNHVNPQRSGYALGKEGGLLLCSWPKEGKLSLPFIYSDEVWTGVEYQVASHLIAVGELEKGLEIVREARKRYNGRIRNPFDEFECGHWYARAMSSYGLIHALTGIRYDAVDKTLYINSKMGDNFKSFIAVDGGWGNAGMKNGKPFLNVKYGNIDVDKVVVSGEEMKLE